MMGLFATILAVMLCLCTTAEERRRVTMPDGSVVYVRELSPEEIAERGFDIDAIIERQLGDVNSILEVQRQERLERQARSRNFRMATNTIAIIIFPALSYISRKWWKKRNLQEEEKLEFDDWLFIIVASVLSIGLVFGISYILVF